MEKREVLKSRVDSGDPRADSGRGAVQSRVEGFDDLPKRESCYLDKRVDELARGKALEKVLRQ